MKPLVAMLALLLLCVPARANDATDADGAADATAAWFATTDRAERARQIARLEADGTPTARFGLGAVTFFGGLERFAQAMRRHGLSPRRSLFLAGFMRGLPRTGGPEGPVEPLDHATFRGHLERLHADMQAARDLLAAVDRGADTRIVIDLGAARLDATGKGDAVTILEIGRLVGLVPPRKATGLIRRRARARDGTRTAVPRPSYPLDTLVFAFDTADAVWLQGYSEVVMAQLDFALAHDFEPLFDATFHVLFPRAGLPMADLLPPPRDQRSPLGDSIVDVIAAIHLTNFAVIDPPRRARVRERLLRVIALSRENWRLIRAETDADREWLPGPEQGDAHPIRGTRTTEAEVEAWLAALDTAEAALEGRVLVPHARLTRSARRRRADEGAPPDGPERGIDLVRFFETTEPFDLVLFVQGAGARPFLREGPVIDATAWRKAQGAFGRRGLWGTALWFN